MKIKTGLLVSAIAVACGATASAAILGMNQLKLDFTKPAVARQARWTKSARLKLGPRGLVFHAPGPEALDLSLQTEPFATGTSWRPAGSVSIRATLRPGATPITLDNGQTYTPSPGQMFARYSPDAKHWSTWQLLATTATSPTGYTFSGQLAVPRQDSAEYGKLVSKYMTLDVPWRSDEEACVRWILKSRPDFFAKQLPFIGYVQFLYEASFAGGQRIESISVDVSFGVGGLHMRPKDPKTSVGRDGPWRLRAP